jgi:hypothetical protein
MDGARPSIISDDRNLPRQLKLFLSMWSMSENRLIGR